MQQIGSHAQPRRRCRQTLVQHPQYTTRRQAHPGEQTCIYIPNVQPVQCMDTHETGHFFSAGHAGLGQVLHSIKDRGALPQAAQGQFAVDALRCSTHTEVHTRTMRTRPCAGRRALSCSIRALRASRTRADFSFKPVQFSALTSSPLSRANVVCRCTRQTLRLQGKTSCACCWSKTTP